MMPPMNLRGWLASLLLLAVTLTLPARADPEKTLTGRWSASTARTSWNVQSWGDACGPRPVGQSVPGGIVSITANGSELSIDGLGRNYSTRTCWETGPSQRITSHGASPRAWRTVCESAAGDPRRATIITSLSATDSQIDFVETGQFEFAIEGVTCRASMKRSRTYSLVEREGEPRPSPPQQPLPASTAPATTTSSAPLPAQKPEAKRGDERPNVNCSNPSAPARIEVRPTRKLLRAGDEYSFRVRVLDRAGCLVDRQLTWKLDQSTTRIDVTPNGIIRVPKDAAEGSGTLTATVQDRVVQVAVDVVSERRYSELLQGGTFDDRGETRDSVVVTIESVNVGTRTAILEQKARSRRLVFIAVIGVIALGLAGAALWIAFGRRKRLAGDEGAAFEVAADPAGIGRENGLLVCPTCREEYPAGTRFCAVDGNRLVPVPTQGTAAPAEGGVCPVCGQGFDPGVLVCPTHDEELVPRAAHVALQAPPATQIRRICPICGTVYGAENQFCGNDGTALVPIN